MAISYVLFAFYFDFSFQSKGAEPGHMKFSTIDEESNQKNSTLLNTASIREVLSGKEAFERHSTCNLVQHEKGNSDSNCNDENEGTDHIFRDLDPLPKRNSIRKLCSNTVNHKRQNNLEVAETNKVQSPVENNQDVIAVQTTAGNICNRKPLRVPPLSAVNGVTQRLFPETSWNQKENTVHITIHLVGVEHYKCCVSSSHLIFM